MPFEKIEEPKLTNRYASNRATRLILTQDQQNLMISCARSACESGEAQYFWVATKLHEMPSGEQWEAGHRSDWTEKRRLEAWKRSVFSQLLAPSERVFALMSPPPGMALSLTQRTTDKGFPIIGFRLISQDEKIARSESQKRAAKTKANSRR